MCAKNIKNMQPMVWFSKYVGSIRMQHILQKTENWKHCCKIIFKCVNSDVGPIFNISFRIKWLSVLWIVQFFYCIVNPCAWTVLLLFIRFDKNKKKGNVKLKTHMRNKPNPNGQVVMLIFTMEVVVLIYNQICSETLLIS